MAVRVKLRVRVKGSGKHVVLITLVNGGAESPRPCIVVTPEVAEELGLWPPRKAEVYIVEEASSTAEAYLIPDAVELELLGEGGEVLERVDADLVVQEGLGEPLITDVTIDSLGIQVISFGKGLWRHRSDSSEVVRGSAKQSELPLKPSQWGPL